MQNPIKLIVLLIFASLLFFYTSSEFASAQTAGTLNSILNWSTTISGKAMIKDPVRPSDFYFFHQVPPGTDYNQGPAHLLKSTNYGQTWTQIDQAMFNGNAWGVAIDPNPNRNPNTPPTMYSPSGYGDIVNGVWKSTNGGVNWSNLFTQQERSTCTAKKAGGGVINLNGGNNYCHDFYQIFILPDNPPNHILVTYHYGQGDMLESKDGGQTWDIHNIPFSSEHSEYVFGWDANTWIIFAQDQRGIYRTTTAGRDPNGNISSSAWSRVTEDGAPSTYGHSHGHFTPYVDTNGDVYFGGLAGLICSSNQGATWHKIMTGKADTVAGTNNYLYTTLGGSNGLWRLNKGCNQTTIDHNYHASLTGLPSDWSGNIPPFGVASAFDGTNWVLNFASYEGSGHNGDIWRYIEQSSGTNPPPPPPPAPTVNISASPTSISSGGSSTLTWSSTNATSCTSSGAWSGTRPTSGTSAVTPTSNSTYTLVCTGSGGATTASTMITVNNQTPVSTIRNNTGNSYTDTQGNVWSADSGSNGGGIFTTTSAITNTSDQALYQTERYGNVSYSYNMPNGNYNVTLKFAEIWWTSTGQRRFNVSINGTQVLTNFDIVADAGGAFRATDKTFPATVSNGTMNITFTSVTDNPKISSIQILPASSVTPVVGDINLDHIVNSIDYSILNSRWFTADDASDLNDDGIVNAIDYSILNQNWFRTW